MNVFSDLTKNINIGSLGPGSPYFKAAIIIFLLFILLLVLAKMSRGYVSWYMSGWYIWLGLGFIFAVIIEGFLLVGGSTIITQVLGWRNAPKPIASFLDAGHSTLVKVLGVQDETPQSESVISDYQSLPAGEAEKVRLQICEPQP